MGYTSFKLSQNAIEFLRENYPPRYPDLPSSPHVTYEFGVNEQADLPEAQELKIVGMADDGKGIQAFVVEVDGEKYKPDSNHFHISWSYDNSKTAPAEFDKNPDPEKRKARPYKTLHSNGLIREQGYTEFSEPVIITDFHAAYTESGSSIKKSAAATPQPEQDGPPGTTTPKPAP